VDGKKVDAAFEENKYSCPNELGSGKENVKN